MISWFHRRERQSDHRWPDSMKPFKAMRGHVQKQFAFCQFGMSQIATNRFFLSIYLSRLPFFVLFCFFFLFLNSFFFVLLFVFLKNDEAWSFWISRPDKWFISFFELSQWQRASFRSLLFFVELAGTSQRTRTGQEADKPVVAFPHSIAACYRSNSFDVHQIDRWCSCITIQLRCANSSSAWNSMSISY